MCFDVSVVVGQCCFKSCKSIRHKVHKTLVKKAGTKIVPIYVQIAISGIVPIRLAVGKNTIPFSLII